MTTNLSSALTNFFQSPNHSSFLHYLRSMSVNPTSPLLMNGPCPWLWAPTLPQRWKHTIRLSLYVLLFRICSPFKHDYHRPNKTSQKLQVDYSSWVFPMKLKARSRCWTELGTDSHRILGHRNNQRWTVLGWYFVVVLPQSVSYILLNLSSPSTANVLSH